MIWRYSTKGGGLASITDDKKTIKIDKSKDFFIFLPPAARGAFLKNRPPGPPEKLLCIFV
jgi:hypothetical protein